MNKNILILASSYRLNANSEQLAKAFAQGAKAAGHNVEFIYLRDQQIGFCQGCLACLNSGHCAINDDAIKITKKMHDADVLVFATPVYYYSVSGQLKTMLDRANPLFGSDYAFTKVYLLASAAEDAPHVIDGTKQVIQGWVDCFDRCELVKTIFAGGVNKINDIRNHAALNQAYQAGYEI